MSGLEPGFQLGHYRILRSLGSGGMADVYEAHDDHLDRTVALKILPVEYSRNPQLVQRFQKEVRAAAKLNHRNIVTVFEVGQQDSWHFFSMRLLTGGDLRHRIQRGLTPVEALAILRELADAFSHAHARGFVHRDVKPENVMFDEQGFPVLTDFGIAKALNAETRMTRTGMTMGTPRYLAPEQASGKPVDARADLYSLGVILYEMLTGHPPYDAEESMAVIFKHVTEPIPVMSAEFTRFQPLLNRLMAKVPAQRIGSAEELLSAIDELSGDGAAPKPSQVRTAENPLLAGLLAPSPLRTPAPKTPRPVTPAPVSGDGSGEVAVAPPRVAAA
ncbi:MAG: serine/threonine-protein kinase, partial [Nevskiaceae bacterium]